MKITFENEVQHSLQPNPHPYMNGAWTPNFDRVRRRRHGGDWCHPTDIDGVYIRNTENPVQEPIGNYHPFDGDGMLHTMRFTGVKRSTKIVSSGPADLTPSRKLARPFGPALPTIQTKACAQALAHRAVSKTLLQPTWLCTPVRCSQPFGSAVKAIASIL